MWSPPAPVHECAGAGVRDLPGVLSATVIVELHRLRCPECGVKIEKIEQLPGKAPFSKRFEEMWGKPAKVRRSQLARRLDLPESTVRAIDLRYLERWAAAPQAAA